MTWIQTDSGKRFDFLTCDPETIDIEDIAHALSMQCRFNGHIKAFYSVAEHSVRVMWLVSHQHRLAALMHDAHEAYTGDCVRPLKPLLGPTWDEIELSVQSAIGQKFGFGVSLPTEVENADLSMLAAEARDLMRHPPKDWGPLPPADPSLITPWSPFQAKTYFLSAFYALVPETTR